MGRRRGSACPNTPSMKICISLVEKGLEAALEALSQAETLADLVEIRLDALESPAVRPFLERARLPLLFTFRDAAEGGLSEIALARRLEVLEEALVKGAELVDLELRSGKEAFSRLLHKARSPSQVLASFHDFSGTPSETALEEILDEILSLGVGLGKIVTTAQRPEDNLTVLGLIPKARKRGFPLVAFAMGPLGRLSRVAAPILGAPFTYACLPGHAQAAPGQINAQELRHLLEKLQEG